MRLISANDINRSESYRRYCKKLRKSWFMCVRTLRVETDKSRIHMETKQSLTKGKFELLKMIKRFGVA